MGPQSTGLSRLCFRTLITRCSTKLLTTLARARVPKSRDTRCTLRKGWRHASPASAAVAPRVRPAVEREGTAPGGDDQRERSSGHSATTTQGFRHFGGKTLMLLEPSRHCSFGTAASGSSAGISSWQRLALMSFGVLEALCAKDSGRYRDLYRTPRHRRGTVGPA
jgi:hypothetical protein